MPTFNKTNIMEINWIIIGIVLLILLFLVIFLIKRNLKDKENLETFFNKQDQISEESEPNNKDERH